MSRLTERLIAALLVLFLLVYVGYQAVKFLYAPVKTEAVYEYSVTQSLSGAYVVFRDEVVLTNDTGVSGYESYLYDDGERVLVGAAIVEYYASESGSTERRQLLQTEQEIAMLTEAQNTAINHVSNAEALGREIKQQLSQLVQMGSTGAYDDLDSLRPTLVSLLNKRQVATGQETSYESRIAALESQRASLESNSERNTLAALYAPQSGYFAHATDGLETRLNSAFVLNADLDTLLDVFDGVEHTRSDAGTGRLVTNQNWYVAVVVNKYDVQWSQIGSTLNLDFEEMSGTVPGTIVDIVDENSSDDAVMIVSSNYINANTVNLRSGTVTLNFQQFTGLRINTAHLRFEGNERGLYVLEKGVIRFKRIDPIYEEAGFILSRQPENAYDTGTVRLFDQVVTKGTDLYDGKIVE